MTKTIYNMKNKLIVFALTLAMVIVQTDGNAACQNQSSTQTFDLTQTAFIFNIAANYSSAVAGDAQTLANFTYSAVTNGNTANPYNNIVVNGVLNTLGCQLIGSDWKLVWGPGVYEILPSSTGRADNTAYVVYSPSLDTYILAIAGTDPNAVLN